MIQINLLPKELRKKKKKLKVPDVTLVFLPITAALVGLLILIQLIMMLAIGINKGTYARLDKEWKEILPDIKMVDALKKEVARIQAKVNAIDELMVKRILWSRKMNDLNDSLIPGIWLTKLNLVSSRGSNEVLNLEGSASSAYGDETATVGKFIESLKGNESFFSDFSDIELEGMQRRVIKEIEVMNFKINGYFETQMITDKNTDDHRQKNR